ncbi:hypothetical protein LLH23_00660 [bacterium]|nr:hypothetical protein [bacterium]
MASPRLWLALLPVLLCAPTWAGDLTWRHVGPGGGGWIQSLACDPRDPDTLYLGCDVGGFYLSRDGGKSWSIQNTGLTDYFVECLAVHPRDSHILLLGCEGGICKSTDQGQTWQEKRQGFPTPERHRFAAPVGALCFDPTKPDVLYAGIGRPRWGKDGAGAIYRSEDCGESWKLITPPGTLPEKAIVSDLEVAPDGSYVLAATSAGLYRSADGGATWERAGGLPDQSVLEAAIAPGRAQIAYCTLQTTARDDQPWNGGVWRSDDGGRTWTRRSEGLSTRVGKTGQSSRMTSNLKEIVVDPRDADTVYVGDQAWVSAGVCKSTNGGQSWQRASQQWGDGKNMDYGWITQWGPSVECLALSPTQPDRVIFGTSGQVFLTDNAGKTWEQRYCRQFPDGRFTGTGLEVTCFNDCLPDPLLPGRLYFCYFDIGLLISDDGGATFRTSYLGLKDSGNCFVVARDPADTEKLWAASGQWGSNVGTVSRSTDGGKTWALVGEAKTGLPCGQVRSLLVDPTSPPGQRRLFATCKGYGIYGSDDDGGTWRCLNADLPAEAVKSPCRLLMDPADPRHLRVALGGHPDQGSGIHETRDAGQTWRKTSQEPLFCDLQAFVAAPQRFDTLYVCQREHYEAATKKMYPGGLFRSDDGGVTWTRLHDFHFASCVAVSPKDPNVLYLGTTDHPYHDNNRALGLLVSRDGGKTWHAENDGLTSWHISCLRVDPTDPGRLYVGTGGNGGFIGTDSAIQ